MGKPAKQKHRGASQGYHQHNKGKGKKKEKKGVGVKQKKWEKGLKVVGWVRGQSHVYGSRNLLGPKLPRKIKEGPHRGTNMIGASQENTAHEITSQRKTGEGHPEDHPLKGDGKT